MFLRFLEDFVVAWQTQTHVDRGIIFVQSLCQVYDVFFDISMQYFMMEMSMFGFCNVVLTSLISLFGVMCPTVLNWVGLVRPLKNASSFRMCLMHCSHH